MGKHLYKFIRRFSLSVAVAGTILFQWLPGPTPTFANHQGATVGTYVDDRTNGTHNTFDVNMFGLDQNALIVITVMYTVSALNAPTNTISISGSSGSYTQQLLSSQADIGDTFRVATFYKIASASEDTSPTVTFSNNVLNSAYVAMEINGVNTTTPISGSAEQEADSTTVTGPSVTLSGNNGFLYFAYGAEETFCSGISGMSQRARDENGPIGSVCNYYQNFTTQTSSGSKTTSISPAGRNAGHMLGINSSNNTNIYMSGYGWYENIDVAYNTTDNATPDADAERPQRIVYDDTNDYIYTVGETTEFSYEPVIEKRDRTDGSLVTSWGNNGYINGYTNSFERLADSERVLHVDPGDDALYLLTTSYLYKFVASTGVLDTTFSGDGKIPSGNNASELAFSATDVYVAEDYFLSSNYAWRVRSWSKSTGSASNFSTLDSDPYTSASDHLDSIEYDSGTDTLYLFGPVNNNGGYRIERRDAGNGNLCDGLGECDNIEFGTGGVIEHTTHDYYTTHSVRIGGGSNLYLSGYTGPAGAYQHYIEKRGKTDGAFNTSFGGGDGHIVVTSSGALDMTFDASTYIYSREGSNIRKRLASSGNDSATLSQGGYEPTSFDAFTAFLYDIDDDRFISGGYVNDETVGPGRSWSLEKRQESNGTLCNGTACGGASFEFGDGGILTENISNGGDANNTILVDDTDDAVYYAGYHENTTNLNRGWRIEKRSTTGNTYVTSFDTDGVVADNTPGSIFEEVTALAVDTTGNYLYAGGYDGSGGSGGKQWRINKYQTSNGALCDGTPTCNGGTWGAAGEVTIDPTSEDDTIVAMRVDETNGYLYVLGTVNDDGTASADSALRLEKRRVTDGALCTAANCGTEFGTGGVITVDPDIYEDFATALALTNDENYIFVVGNEESSTANEYAFRVEKRRVSDGALCTAANCGTEFGTAGVLIYDASASGVTYVDNATDIVLDSSDTYMFVAGLDTSQETMVQKRRVSDGALCTAANCGTEFGTGGINSDFSTPDSNPATDPFEVQLSYFESNDTLLVLSNRTWRAYVDALNATTGALDTTFNSGSTLNFTTMYYYSDMALSPEQGYIYFNRWNSGPGSASTSYGVSLATTGADALIGERIADFNTALNTAGDSTPVRLRTLVHTDDGQPTFHYNFTLKYSAKSGTCDAAGTGENYVDFASSTLQIHDNQNLATAIQIKNDGLLGHNGHTVVDGFYDESVTGINTLAVGDNQDMVFGFPLVDTGSNFDDGFCIRIEHATDIPLDDYPFIPEMINCSNPPQERRLRGGKYFCTEELRPFIWNGDSANFVGS